MKLETVWFRNLRFSERGARYLAGLVAVPGVAVGFKEDCAHMPRWGSHKTRLGELGANGVTSGTTSRIAG